MSETNKSIPADINTKGEYALWDKGKFIGYGKMDMFNGKMVLASKKDVIKALFDAALADNITLILNQGFRSFGQQVYFRKKYVKDKSKKDDENYILTAPSSEFHPACAKPGWSNHQDGTAYDIDTVDDAGKIRPAYKWLIDNALKFGFVRTVASETWHWEHRPEVKDMYAIVPKDHPSWATS